MVRYFELLSVGLACRYHHVVATLLCQGGLHEMPRRPGRARGSHGRGVDRAPGQIIARTLKTFGDSSDDRLKPELSKALRAICVGETCPNRGEFEPVSARFGQGLTCFHVYRRRRFSVYALTHSGFGFCPDKCRWGTSGPRGRPFWRSPFGKTNSVHLCGTGVRREAL